MRRAGLAFVILAGITASCGGGDSGPSTTTSPSPSPTPTQAQPVVAAEQTSGTVLQYGNPLRLGQSVTIVGGPFNSLRFSWTDRREALVPTAFGRLFLFSQPYTGPIDSLGESAPGFMAVAAAANNEYVFDTRVTVQPGQKYWFYIENSDTSQFSVLTSDGIFGTTDVYPGGDMYTPGYPPGQVGSGPLRFVVAIFETGRPAVDARFRLLGRPVNQ